MNRRIFATMLAAIGLGVMIGFSPLFGQSAPATQPATPRFGQGGNRFTVTFVCDAGDSIAPDFDKLRQELSKAVEGLHPYQKFSIIFMQAKQPASLDQELTLATPANKVRAEAFLKQMQAKGKTDPIPALDLAFRQQPMLIYILANHDFPDNAKMLDEIQKLDPNHAIKVNTIAFTDSSDHDVDFKKMLQQIANETGGTFKAVNADDLDDTTRPATLPATRP